MLVKQALLARDIWLGQDSDDALTERIIKKLNADSLNIVLAGMPSCGKSTIGKLLAKTLNKNFIDVDSEIEKFTGKTPSQIITENGEGYFRDIESEVIKNLALVKGSVISLGGGSVLRQENVINLKLNGLICYIERDLSLLETQNRPLSQNNGLETLYNNRKGVYNSVCDFKVVNDTTIENAVKEIIIKYENSCN
jgi:shikimate dehydrogenase